MDASSRAPESDPGAVVAELSREIVQLHARMYGRGPTKARSYLRHEYALCVLEEIFTQAEKTLVANGNAEHVRDTRMKFQDAVAKEFIAIAEKVTGRTVRIFFSQVEVQHDTAVELFLFEDEPPAGKEEDDLGPDSH